jgi:hypothetical protein
MPVSILLTMFQLHMLIYILLLICILITLFSVKYFHSNNRFTAGIVFPLIWNAYVIAIYITHSFYNQLVNISLSQGLSQWSSW